MHPYFHIFGLSLPAYSVMAVIALVLGALWMLLRGKRRGLPAADVFYMFLFAVLFMAAGAKILATLVEIPDIVAHFPELFDDPIRFVMDYAGGLVFYGGLIGAFCGAYVYAYAFREPFCAYLCTMVPVVPFIHAVMRVGCFLSGCCYGIAVPWGIAFDSPIGGAPGGVPLMPVPLFEAAGDLLICLALIWFTRRLQTDKKGGVRAAAIYFISYGVLRFCLEFFRGDAVRGHLWIFSTSQWISLILIALSVIALCMPGRVVAFSDRHTVDRPKKVRKNT